ncbi:MAG TPA: hypothetical protein DE038_01355 [Nitrospina sp.]|nr:hypothetical protein [Nitrospina sp.]
MPNQVFRSRVEYIDFFDIRNHYFDLKNLLQHLCQDECAVFSGFCVPFLLVRKARHLTWSAWQFWRFLDVLKYMGSIGVI